MFYHLWMRRYDSVGASTGSDAVGGGRDWNGNAWLAARLAEYCFWGDIFEKAWTPWLPPERRFPGEDEYSQLGQETSELNPPDTFLIHQQQTTLAVHNHLYVVSVMGWVVFFIFLFGIAGDAPRVKSLGEAIWGAVKIHRGNWIWQVPCLDCPATCWSGTFTVLGINLVESTFSWEASR